MVYTETDGHVKFAADLICARYILRTSPLEKLRFLADRDFWRSVLPLALPITLQNLLTASFHLVDTLMVGQLGDATIAAVGVAGQISMFINIIFFGITAGGSVFIAQYHGARDRDGISRVYGLMMTFTIPAALIFALIGRCFSVQLLSIFTNEPELIELGAKYLRVACLSYIGIGLNQAFCIVLRSTEEVRLPMLTSATGVLLNAAANYALIFGKWGFPSMGVEGAALATVISASCGPVLLLAISLKRRNALRAPIRKMLSYNLAFVRAFWKRSLPILFNETIWSVGVMGYNMVFGRMGADNYAALTIFRTIENLGFVMFIGICNACAVLVGKRIGEGNEEAAKVCAGRFLILVPLVGAAVGVLLLLLTHPILNLFNITPDVRRTAHSLLIIYAVEIGVRNIPYVAICGIFRAGGDTKTGLKYDAICLYGIALPLVIVSAFWLKLPFLAVYVLMLLGEDLLKSYLCIRHYRGMSWIRPVVDVQKTA